MALGRLQRAAINVVAAGAGDNQLVAAVAASGAGINAVPAQKIVVVAGVLVCSAASMNPFFRSAANTTTMGPLPLAANGGIVLPMMGDEDEAAWFVTNPGEALNLNVAAAGNVGGTLFYKTQW